MTRAPLVVVLLLLTSCFASNETRNASEDLAEAYGDTAGAVQVHTEAGLDGQNREYVETVVNLDRSATVDQVVEVIVGHPAKVAQAGLGSDLSHRYLRFEYPGGPTLAMEWKGVPAEAAIRDGVEHWQHLEDLLGPDLQLVLGSDGSELYGVQGDGAEGVGAVYRNLAADPVMSTDDAVWDVTATHGPTKFRLAVDDLPTDQQLGAWDALVASLDRLPAEHAPVGLDVGIADRATVQVDLEALPGTTEEELTPETHGGLLWPALRRQLDVVPDLAADWGYFVDWAPTDSPTSATALISLLSDTSPVDDAGTTYQWSKAAYDRVNAP